MRINIAAFASLVILATVDISMANSCADLKNILARNKEESASLQAMVSKLEGDNVALCNFGRKQGTPAFKRWIRETHATGQCAGIANRTRADYERIFATHKKIVARDCKRAGM